jgi:hypothetical protein
MKYPFGEQMRPLRALQAMADQKRAMASRSIFFTVLAYMLMDGHRAGREAIFINFYFLATRFLLAFNFKFLIALANFFFAHFFHICSRRLIFLLSVAAFIGMPVGMLLNWRQ